MPTSAYEVYGPTIHQLLLRWSYRIKTGITYLIPNLWLLLTAAN